MPRRTTTTIAAALLLATLGAETSGALSAPAAYSSPSDSDSSLPRLSSLSLNSSFVTVSGISSGAYMAVQMHVAYSSTIKGVGVVAGGPFFCAGLWPTSVTVAQTTCMIAPKTINVDALVATTKNTALTGTIDPLKGLANAKLFAISGTNDTVVHTGVVEKLAHYYGEFVTQPGNIAVDYTVPAEHSMPTKSYGNKCDYLGEPYINNCGYDAAGKMLQHLFSNQLAEPTDAAFEAVAKDEFTGTFLQFSQREFLDPLWTLPVASMYSTGVVYIPPACAAGADRGGKGPCLLHVAYHGCKQTIPEIDAQFYQHAGYVPWADANDMVVLFPQAAVSATMNPNGCWDWWGYTGNDYASNLGEQMRVNKKMIQRLL